MIHFLGTSYAAVTLKEAARRRGLKLTENIKEANLIFVSEDTPTDENGNRDLDVIRNLIIQANKGRKFHDTALVVTSQVTPGFMMDTMLKHVPGIYHQAETLRIEDGMQRAMYPEMFIVGKWQKYGHIDSYYREYLEAFDCPILEMTFVEAALCKIAINMRLISQVESTNLLAQVAENVGADWSKIAKALRHDSRIGKYSYLTPGDWRKSKHLLRDYVTLNHLL